MTQNQLALRAQRQEERLKGQELEIREGELAEKVRSNRAGEEIKLQQMDLDAWGNLSKSKNPVVAIGGALAYGTARQMGRGGSVNPMNRRYGYPDYGQQFPNSDVTQGKKK